MNQFIISEILKERTELEQMIHKLEKVNLHAPKGNLRVMTSKGKYYQFYLVEDKTKDMYPHGRYLRKDEKNLAEKIAQKEFNQKTIEACRERIKAIDRFIYDFEKFNPETIFERSSPARKSLIVPTYVSDNEFRIQWLEETKGNQNGMPYTKEFITGRNEIVRSKSEVILANLFDKLGIDYVYEPALYFDYSCFYPDFGLLDIKNRKTVYYEHFGKMDDPDYSVRVMEKMNMYMKNGIRLGQDLLFSMESLDNPLDIRIVEKMLRTYFL